MRKSREKKVISGTADERKMSRRYLLFLSFISGFMLSFSFPPWELGVLACFGLIPLLLVFELTDGYSRPLRFTYVVFFILQIITVYWMGGFVHLKHTMQMVGGGLLLVAHPFFFFIPVIGYLAIRRTFGLTPALIALPFIWVGYEYVHSIGDLAFPWQTLGNTQSYDLPRLQIISVTGIYGLSFWIMVLNVAGFVLFRTLALRIWKPGSIQAISLAALIVILHLLPSLYGTRVLNARMNFEETLRVGIVQPDTDPFEKWDTDRRTILEQLISQSEMLLPENPDLIVWPENAVPFYVLLPQNRIFFWRLREFIDEAGVPLLTGLPHAVFFPEGKGPPTAKVIPETGERYASYNAAAFFKPGTDEYEFYGKIVLVPFAEKIPYSDLFEFAVRIRRNIGVGGWDAGQDTTVFSFPRDSEPGIPEEVTFGVVICYESVYPGFVRHFANRGAGLILVITNDSWWGRTPGPRQHHQFSIIRAIENRRSIARAANGGISSFIDPYGVVLFETRMFTRTQTVYEVPVVREKSYYVRYGDWFAKGCLLLGMLPVMAAAGENMRKRIFAFQNKYSKNND